MNENLKALAAVPRRITQELEDLVPEDHTLSIYGARAILVGVVAALGCAGLALLSVLPWSSALLGVLLAAAGYVLRQSVKERARAAGRARLARLPLTLVGVVQANRVLYDPEQVQWAPAVIVYARDAAGHDPVLIQSVAERLSALREGRTGHPELDAIGASLANEQSDFSVKVPAVMTGGADLVIETTVLDPRTVPGGYLRRDTLLAGLLSERGKLFAMLPAASYANRA